MVTALWSQVWIVARIHSAMGTLVVNLTGGVTLCVQEVLVLGCLRTVVEQSPLPKPWNLVPF